ncbi:MAG: hypothetical protein FWG20_06695 [Candidatus Cloacimonetes bacterium]|nr:hypothetical protein [Candidatus Cloacimonadota bacterium]
METSKEKYMVIDIEKFSKEQTERNNQAIKKVLLFGTAFLAGSIIFGLDTKEQIQEMVNWWGKFLMFGGATGIIVDMITYTSYILGMNKAVELQRDKNESKGMVK